MAAVNEHDPEVEMGEMQSSPVKDAPPTPPPKELPQWRAASLPAFVEAPPAAPTPAPGPPRLKKKIPWKGKNIMVLLPWDDERGQKGKAPAPMNQKDVDAMVREWEQLGYDTTGFNLGPTSPDTEEGSQGQSRGIWPYDQDVLIERSERSFKVNIPDRRGEFWCFHLNLLCGSSLSKEDVRMDLHSSVRIETILPYILLDGGAEPSIHDICRRWLATYLSFICHILHLCHVIYYSTNGVDRLRMGGVRRTTEGGQTSCPRSLPWR
jgi:hypothetical protein